MRRSAFIFIPQSGAADSLLLMAQPQRSTDRMRKLIATLWLVALVALVISTGGCAGWRYGQTKKQAWHRYLLVGKDQKSFGYKRLRIIENYRPPMKGFVEYHGPPDFFYEFTTENGRAGVRFYYVQRNLVYIFHERNWNPSSMFFVEQRPLTSAETEIHSGLLAQDHDRSVEPSGAATGSLPAGSETNRTSGAAGPGG